MRDGDALLHVLDQLEPRFGRVDAGRLHVERRQIDAHADLETVRAEYASQAAHMGLRPLALNHTAGSWAIAFADGDQLLAVEAIEPAKAGGEATLPLALITTKQP